MIAAVVVAAGRSSRMGAHKLLLPLGDRPVIAQVVAAVLATSLRPVVVVVGHEAARVRAALPPGEFHVIENPTYADGLATSLRAGISALPQTVAGAVVVLGDQPLITAAQLELLVNAARAAAAGIVAASYASQRGNPVYFARRYFPELLAVTGDEGGRAVITRHADALALCELGDASASLDIDLPADYERVRTLWDERQRPADPPPQV
jgi:molybdenum cofactor cytidylyltransferase